MCTEIRITAKGNTGHALHFIKNTAAEKTQKIINSFLSFRESEKAKLGEGEDAAANLGNVTTLNMTMIQVNYINVYLIL
jgi:aminoacylase